MLVQHVVESIKDKLFEEKNVMMVKKVKGTVVLMKKNVLDFTDFHASFLDRLHELLGQGVSFHLVSSTVGDPSK